MSRPRVVIVGGGFAGLAAARTLAASSRRRAAVDVTLLDRHDHRVFTPFLYQVATALREPSTAAQPIRSRIRTLPHVEFRQAEVTGFDAGARRVHSDRGPVDYDYLVLAAGAINAYRDNAEIASHSFGLNDLAEALALRDQLLTCLEAAAWADDPARRAQLLRFAVIGGGATGVELSAALAAAIKRLVERDFPQIAADEPRIVLMEAADTPLGSLPVELRQAAASGLGDKGVEIECGVRVAVVDEEGVTTERGRRIEAATVVWAAGVQASALAQALPVTGSHGRVVVDPTLQVARHPEVFVVGDMAEMPGDSGPLPMLAEMAIQSGRHAARSVLALCGDHAVEPFHGRDRGTMTTLGRGDALAQIGSRHLSGLAGWLAWLRHVVRLAGPETGSGMLLGWVSGSVFERRPVRTATRPDRGWRAGAPQEAPARVDLPSVNVSNADAYGRMAALAWWTQDLPGRQPPPGPPPGPVKRLRARVVKLRHEAFGIKSQTEVDNRR